MAAMSTVRSGSSAFNSHRVGSGGEDAACLHAGWHWEEKNQMGWSRQKLEELLVGLLVDMSALQGSAKVTVLKDLRGEVQTSPLPMQTQFCTLGLLHMFLPCMHPFTDSVLCWLHEAVTTLHSGNVTLACNVIQ